MDSGNVVYFIDDGVSELVNKALDSSQEELFIYVLNHQMGPVKMLIQVKLFIDISITGVSQGIKCAYTCFTENFDSGYYNPQLWLCVQRMQKLCFSCSYGSRVINFDICHKGIIVWSSRLNWFLCFKILGLLLLIAIAL